MREYGMLLGPLFAAAVMTNSAGASPAKLSTITSVDIARVLPVGIYAGLTYRYIEGEIHGEVSAEEPVAGLRELAAGRGAIPYEVNFHIVAPEPATEADTVVVEAPNRGRSIFPGVIGVPADPKTDPAADPASASIPQPSSRRQSRCAPPSAPCSTDPLPPARDANG